jgi:hypothetical protein
MNVELKSCPFCGAPGELEHMGGPGSTHRIAKCSKCKCDMHFWPTVEMAADKWNTRCSTAQVAVAFDMIARANTVTILSLGEMESIVNRSLAGEFTAVSHSQENQK